MSREGNALWFDLSGIPLRIDGLDPGCAALLARSWAPFRGRPGDRPVLDVAVALGEVEVPSGTVSAKHMTCAFAHGGARFALREGRIAVDAEGRALAELSRSDERTRLFALFNLLLPALAWSVAHRGGAVLHSAAVVLGDAAFLLVGAEGAGKSTWTDLAREGGALPLSDDVNLLDAAGDAPVVLGSPFRTETFGSPGPGRWPLRAILLPAHGPGARLDPAAPLEVRARLTANLLWLAEAIEVDPAPLAAIERLIRAVPLRRLTFDRTPAFVETLRRLGDAAG